MRVGALLTVAAVALAGCSVGGGGPKVEAAELSNAVLQPGDLPRVFLRFDEGRQGLVDVQARFREGLDRFGHEAGWKARYRRSGTNETSGPLVVASLVNAFDSTDGAEDALAVLREEGQADLAWRTLDAPDLGDAAVAKTTLQGAGPTAVRSFLIGWREENAVATLELNGFEGRFDFADAVAIAQKQARRVADAAS